MKTFAKITMAIAIALLATGCCPCRSYQKKTRRPLVGTTWQLVQLGGRSIRPQNGHFTLRLAAADELTGTGACNRLSGKYATDKKRTLEFGPIAATRMTCPDLPQEEAFIRALETTTHYDMDGPMLMLLCDGELRAVLQAVPEPNEK